MSDPSIELRSAVERWLADFETAVKNGEGVLFSQLFTDEACWRDTVALTWDYRQAHSRDQLQELLLQAAGEAKPRDFTIAEKWPAPGLFGPAEVVEFFFTFQTNAGTGEALVRAIQEPDSTYGFRAFQFHTRITGLHAAEDPETHPAGYGFDRAHPKENWAQYRERVSSFDDREPEVLIVGGGHSGLMLAAHLDKLGISNLVVDKNPRVGDNWRNRYHNLALHTPVQMVQFPYLRYPDHFPTYLSKDKLGDWLETYATTMDLNVWTDSAFLGGSYDEQSRTWTARVDRAGTRRELRPRHVVLATGGVGGKPKLPALPGLDSFAGDVMHSSDFPGGDLYAGKRAVVVGVGTSAHDIAYDLHANGAAVTMVQRNRVAVVSIESANLGYSDYFNGVPDDLVDFRFAADLTLPLFQNALNQYQAMVAELDADLLAGLEKAGMQLEEVTDGRRSWFAKFFENGGGYYLNIGTSDIIADGGIAVVQASDVMTYTSTGLTLADGSTIEADVVVLATGYEDRQTQLVDLFGSDLADRIGPVGRGWDDDGEWRNVWKPTAQPGLWFMLGGIKDGRPNAHQLAHLLAADVLELVPSRV